MNGVPLSPEPLVRSHSDPIRSVSWRGVVPSETIFPTRSASFFLISCFFKHVSLVISSLKHLHCLFGAACALGILVVKSETECLLYLQPFLVRAGKNMSAFIADAAVLILSLPVCEAVDRPARRMFPELVRK